MKLKTYQQRDERFIKASEMLTNYLLGKERTSGLTFAHCTPEYREYKFMTMEELREYNVPVFQRELQFGRLRNIADSMFVYGFDRSKPVVLTLPGMFVLDGNNRLTVASVALDKDDPIPVVILKFRNLSEEAAYFKMMQNPPGGPPVIEERIKSSFYAKEPYGLTIYNLGLIDPRSIFSTEVNFRKRGLTKKYVDETILQTFMAKKCTINVGAFVRIFHWIGLHYRRTWERSKEQYMNYMISQMDYDVILNRLNEFGVWLFGWVGSDKKELYKQTPLTGFLDFYLTVMHQPTFTQKKKDKILKLASNKFVKWPFWTSRLMAEKPENGLSVILDYFNGGRSSNRLEQIDGFQEMFGVRPLTPPE